MVFYGESWNDMLRNFIVISFVQIPLNEHVVSVESIFLILVTLCAFLCAKSLK